MKIASIQMDATPAPTADRLARAGRLVAQAAGAGAQLVVLPELFNTGYAYTDANHRLAEPPDGPTPTWMRDTAARLNLHLAGTFMLLDHDEVYNSLLLFAPDGRVWRYDKNYPWGWERGYFRDAHRITVAETDLGHLGMMICWDTAHPRLWRRYAGRVDLMLICSCPPDISNPTFHFPGRDPVTFDDMGQIMSALKGSARVVFGDVINQQAAWLGVPAVQSVGCGHIETPIPNGLSTFLTFLPMAPWLIGYLPQARRMRVSCDMVQGCKVVAADGQVLTELTQEQGEAFTLAEVTLPDERPSPRHSQPPSPLSWFLYFISDVLLPSFTIPVYRNGLRRTWGKHMAPVDPATRKWTAALILGIATTYILTRIRHRRKP